MVQCKKNGWINYCKPCINLLSWDFSLITESWLSLFHYFFLPAAATAKSLQSCLSLWGPIVSNPPGSPVPGILQARILKWVAISFSNAWKWKVKVKMLSHVWLLATPWTAAHQAPPSMGFSRQEYWSGVPLLSPFSYLIASKISGTNSNPLSSNLK